MKGGITSPPLRCKISEASRSLQDVTDKDASSTDSRTKGAARVRGANVMTGWRHYERDRRLPVRATKSLHAIKVSRKAGNS